MQAITFDAQLLINQITQVICFGAGLGFLLAICEWLVTFFIKCATDRFHFKG